MAKTIETRITYAEIILKNGNAIINLPNDIKTFFSLKKEIMIPRSDKTTKELCVVTSIQYKKGLIHTLEEGKTMVFAAKDKEVIAGALITQMPSIDKEKNVFIAIKKHDEVCKVILGDY